MAGGPAYGRVSAAAISDRRLPDRAVRVLGGYAVFADRSGHCYPAVSTVANMVGCSRKTVQRCLRVLEEHGYISILHRKRANGGHDSSIYQLHLPKPPAPLRAQDAHTPLRPQSAQGMRQKPPAPLRAQGVAQTTHQHTKSTGAQPDHHRALANRIARLTGCGASEAWLLLMKGEAGLVEVLTKSQAEGWLTDADVIEGLRKLGLTEAAA